jgi:hypothetical protein
MSRAVFLLAAVLLAISAAAADQTFTGSLRFVAGSTITLRLSNGIVIDGRLPSTGEVTASKIVAQFKPADQVETLFRDIRPVWDESVQRYHQLELKHIRFLRAATPDETALVASSLSWQTGTNLLRPVSDLSRPPRRPDPEGLERVRTVNLAHIRNMPGFVVNEVATRSLRRRGELQWKQIDTVESEVAVHGNNLARSHIRVNGKAYKTGSNLPPGFYTSGGFGEDLKALLEPNCPSKFEPAGREESNGHRVVVYHFNVPVDGCFAPDTWGFEQYSPALSGRILTDETTGDVLQMEYRSNGMPREMGSDSGVAYSWEFVKIGGASYFLPATADSTFDVPDGDSWHIFVRFKDHSHFESSTVVTFQP